MRFIDFLNEASTEEFGKTSSFTFKQLEIEGTVGLNIARRELPNFDEKIKRLPNVLFGSLAKKLFRESQKKSSMFYGILGTELAVSDDMCLTRNRQEETIGLKTEKGCAIFYKDGTSVAQFVAFQSVKQYDKNSFIKELEKNYKVCLGQYEFRMVKRDGLWYGACVYPDDSDDEVISTAEQLDRVGSFDEVVKANLKDRQMDLLGRANEYLLSKVKF